MNSLGEKAFTQLILAWPAVAALVTDRVLWDDNEYDLEYPAILLRLVSTEEGGRDLRSRGGARRCLVELAAIAATSGGASALLDAAIDALEAGEAGPFEFVVAGETARFGAIELQSVQQSPAQREHSYRKSAFFEIWLYD